MKKHKKISYAVTIASFIVISIHTVIQLRKVM